MMRSALLLSSLLVGLGCSTQGSPQPRGGQELDHDGEASEPRSNPVPVGPAAPIPNPNGTAEDPASAVSLTASAQSVAELSALRQRLEQGPTTFAGLQSAHPFTPRAELGYDPSKALNLDLIARSTLSLSPAELETLGKRGLVISSTRTFPTFGDGYAAIYTQDLPLYVSADSILEAVHRSYDAILKAVERQELAQDLRAVLEGLRARLPGAGLDPALAQDLDFYLAVPLGLLAGSDAPPVAGADARQISAWTKIATGAAGPAQLELFGSPQLVDFSQFKPRGHYDDSDELRRYFRAVMWLGRLELRLIETQSDGSTVFRRRAFDATLALGALLDPDTLQHYRQVDDTYRTFVGKSDNMTLDDVTRLQGELGVSGVAGARSLSDATIADAIIRGGYGQQRIASALMTNDTDSALPLSRTFLLLGQRYAIDSEVFSNVVFDRVMPGPNGRVRMMPDPLDVAFAAFGNDQALGLLREQIETFGYASRLGDMRLLADAHGDDFWAGSMYNQWLGALRALSPAADANAAAGSAVPALMSTDAWGRRLLNAQLGSWAQLRRDNVLLVKQSTSTGIGCEYPDAYIEPYPQFFARLGSFAQQGHELAASFSDQAFGLTVSDYFDKLASTMSILRQMAESERTGADFTPGQLEFINQAVTTSRLCGGPAMLSGWYADLFFDPSNSLEYDPTIADVHTAPQSETGDKEGLILHVATASPQLMVVTTETCSGPRAYAGLAFAYRELIKENYQRLTDDEWKALAASPAAPPAPGWLSPVLQP